MWPLKSIILENKPCFEGFNTHVWGFQGDRWENIQFLSKPRLMIPQMDHFGKKEPCSGDFNTVFWGFQGDRLENVQFLE